MEVSASTGASVGSRLISNKLFCCSSGRLDVLAKCLMRILDSRISNDSEIFMIAVKLGRETMVLFEAM